MVPPQDLLICCALQCFGKIRDAGGRGPSGTYPRVLPSILPQSHPTEEPLYFKLMSLEYYLDMYDN